MEKEIKIKMKLEEECIPVFIAFLEELEYNGKIGYSEIVGIFSDGDGNFRPKFEIKGDEEIITGIREKIILANTIAHENIRTFCIDNVYNI